MNTGMEQLSDQYRSFFFEFPDPLLIVDPTSFIILECNKAALALLKSDQPSTTGQSLSSIFSEPGFSLITNSISTGSLPLINNVALINLTHQKFDIDVRLSAFGYGVKKCALLIISNVQPALVGTSSAAIPLEEYILNSLPYPICAKDRQGKLIFANHAYKKQSLLEGLETKPATQGTIFKDKNDTVLTSDHKGAAPKIESENTWISTSPQLISKQQIAIDLPGQADTGVLEITLHNPAKLYDNTLMQILNVMPQNVYLKDNTGRFLLVNHSTADLYNLSAEEMIGKTDRDFYTMNQALEFEKIESEIITAGLVRAIPEEFSVDNNGVMKVKNVTKMPYFIPELNQLGILGINTDITDAKLSEKALKESELKYKMLMEQASDGIYLSDQDGNVVDANHKACEMFGYTIEEFVKLNIKKLIDPKESFEVPLRSTEVKDKQSIIMERRFLKKDGSPFTVELSAKLLGNGRHQAIIRDITERKRLERILKDNEKKFRALIENSSDLIIIVGESFKVRFISSSVKRILGYEADQVMGKSAFEFIHNEESDLISKVFSQALIEPGKKVGSEEIRLKNYAGVYLYFEIVAVNLLLDPNINGIILNCHDITKRKITEIELLNTNFELDSFVYKASHDLKAPLRSVMGLIKLAKYESHDPNLNAYLDLMQKSVISLDAFIKDLTQFSRNSRLDIDAKIIPFDELISESFLNLKYMDDADRVQVIKEINVSHNFSSDITRLSTIINNLLSNAFKYHRFENNKPFIKITVNAGADKAIIIIEDNGAGIEPVHIDKIFEMFYRASESSYGSGLGLYIVKNAVTKLNGSIEVASEVNVGTKFLIIIPNLYNKK